MTEKKSQQINIHLSEEVGQGTYCNLSIITFSPSEFILDFATMLPGLSQANVKSRVILTPENAKRLMLTLQENVSRYESNVGPINVQRKMNIEPFSGKGNA